MKRAEENLLRFVILFVALASLLIFIAAAFLIGGNLALVPARWKCIMPMHAVGEVCVWSIGAALLLALLFAFLLAMHRGRTRQ